MKIHVYRAADGYRWTAKAANGETVADSGEAYYSKHDALKAARRMQRYEVDIPIDRDVDE